MFFLFFLSREQNFSASHGGYSDLSPTPCFSPRKHQGVGRGRTGLPETPEHPSSSIRRPASSLCSRLRKSTPWQTSVSFSTQLILDLQMSGSCFLHLNWITFKRREQRLFSGSALRNSHKACPCGAIWRNRGLWLSLHG